MAVAIRIVGPISISVKALAALKAAILDFRRLERARYGAHRIVLFLNVDRT